MVVDFDIATYFSHLRINILQDVDEERYELFKSVFK